MNRVETPIGANRLQVEQQLPTRVNILDRQQPRLVERLFAKRKLDPDSGCWEWQGRRDRCGYGRITVAHRRYSVHRLAAALFLGFDLAIPLQILHRCHNPPASARSTCAQAHARRTCATGSSVSP